MKRFLAAFLCLCLVVCMLPAQVFAADVTELTLSFADKAQRTTFTTTQQVWKQNGIVVTNNKAGSSSNVADYANPARFYASSELIIAVPGKLITKIVFDASKNASALPDSIGSAATVTVSGTKVTAVLATPAESLTIAKLTKQVQVRTMTITVQDAGGSDPVDPPVEDTTEPSSSETEPSSSATVPSESTPAVEPGETTELTLSFADKANRAEHSTSKQVWKQNGIVLTNNKGTGSNVGDYANPARFYKGSEVIIEVPGYQIKQIVIKAVSSYSDPWASAAKDAGATATNSSNTITINLAESAESFTMALTGGQARANSITVTVVASGSTEPDVPVVPEVPTANAAAYAFQEEYANFAADAVLPATYLYKDHTFNVAWAIQSTNAAGAYIDNGVLKVVQQADSVTYTLTATISLGTDTAPVSYTGGVVGTVFADQATITFDEAKTGRVELNNDKQVWIQNNITFTNNKGEGNNIADYSKPVRLYKNSSITVAYPAMWSIVFDCYDNAYAAALATSIGDAAKKDADKVTVTFSQATDSYTVDLTADQVRVDSITVSQVAPHTHSYDEGVITTTPGCETEGVKTFTCSCGVSYTEPVAATGHSYDEGVYTNPSFDADGYTTYTCGACGHSYTVVAEDTQKTAVASVNGEKFDNFEDAFAAATANGASEIVVLRDTALTSIKNTENYYDVVSPLTITAPAGESYTITNCGFAVRVYGNGASLTIAENVTIEGLDIVANGYATTGENFYINGTLNALSLKQWTNNGTIYVSETGKVWLTSHDGQLDLAYGNGTLTIVGTGDMTAPQFKAGYSGTRGNGNTLNLQNTYFEGGAWFNLNGSNGTINVDNSLLKVSGGDFAGSMAIGATGNVINLTNGAVLEVGPLTLAEGNKITIDGTSQIKATTLSGKGVITIDAANLTVGAAPIVGNASNFAGTIEVINNTGVEAQIDENGNIVLVEKVYTLEGEGTEANPYLIQNLDDLKHFRDKVNGGETYDNQFVTLTADIDLAGEAWTPIGNATTKFLGTFDGGNHTISNLVVDVDANNAGLFGFASVIKNVKIENATVSGLVCVGALVGELESSVGTVDNCHVSGTIQITGENSVGGLAGKGYANIKNSSVIGNADSFVLGVYGSTEEGDNIGGLMGHLGEGNTLGLTNVTVKNITVKGTRKVGGVVGTIARGNDIIGCTVDGVTVESTATAEYANANASTTTIGGVVGNYFGTATSGGILKDCSVSNVTLVIGNAKSAGALVGGDRYNNGGAPIGVDTVSNNVVSNVTGATNKYLMPVAQIGDATYMSLAAAVAAANEGDVITVLSDIANEAVVVDKSLTITGSATLENVSIDAKNAGKLTVSGLTFTGNSWINTAAELIVSGVTANVNPKNTAYTNTRSAFISLGNSEGKLVELTVENCNIVSAGGSDPILGWGQITKATLTGNTFGSETAHQNNSDSVKFMSIADGAEFIITGNTIYSDYNGIVFAQNTTRGNAYSVYADGNTFVGVADHIWIEITGGDTVHAAVNVLSNNTVNGNAFTAQDIKYRYGVIKHWSAYAGVDVETDANGKVIGGILAYYAEDAIAEGYEIDANGKVSKSAVATVNGQKFTSLEAAAEAATAGDEIILLMDVTIGELVLPSGVILNGNGKQINGSIVAGEELTIKGHTKITSFSAGFYDHVINIGQDACLEITGTGRVTLGWGCVWNITGTIENAKTADKANVQPSLIVPGGLSITGSGATLNVNNAYVKLGLISSKNSAATNLFDIDFNNSIVDITSNFSFATSTSGKTPTFDIDVKDSVLNLASNLDFANAACDVLVDNSVITVGSSLRNDGNLTLINGSELTVKNQIQSGEHGGNNGIITVDASTLTIQCSSTGHAMDGNNVGKLVLTNGANASIDYIIESEVELAAGTSLTCKTADLAITTEPGCKAFYVDGVYTVKKMVAQVGSESFENLQEAIKAAAPAGTVTLLADVTIDKWIMISETLTIGDGTVITLDLNGLTIDGDGHTLTINEVESANNGGSIFYDGDYNVCDLTLVMGANVNGLGITSGTIENVTFIGGRPVPGGAAIHVSDALVIGTHAGNVTVEGCTFQNNGAAIYYETAQDGLKVNNNTFEISSSANVILMRGNEQFTNNTVVSGRTVNVVSGSPVVSGNDFGDVRLKVYNQATATITGNTINNLAFNDATEPASTIENNTLSAEAEAALDAVTPKAAKIGDVTYKTLAAAIAAVQEGETIVVLAGTVNEGTIKLPATLKNVTIKGEDGAVLENTTISAADGNAYSYIGLTFENLTFDNGRLIFTGWRTGEETIEDLTITGCTFKNLDDTTNTAPVHINKDASKAVRNFTFTNNVIDGAIGGSKSGVYAQITGEVVFTGNTINNVSFRPYVIQLTTDDGIADNFVVTGNTFSGSAAGRAQGLGNNAAGTDTVNLVVSGNIFKDITASQQICYWNFNAETTTADLSKNYYDIDILNNPSKIYFNSAAQNAVDLIEKGVYPYYADEAMTVEVNAPAIMVTYPAGNPTYPEGKIEYYENMIDAVPYTTNCPRLEGATITLLKDVSGAGMRFMENGMVFDLNGHTYTITAGTGSQGSNTSGFQIRPEVTTNVIFKNGTIQVAEGAPVVWMFNSYATDFIVEDVVVDCANMAWGYGASCYVVVSRAGDNVQFLGNTKIENFNASVAGYAVNVGGTMTIGENVAVGGSVELDIGATLTAPAGLVVETADGYKVIYADGVYSTAKCVVQIGETKYESLEAAFAAAAEGDTIVLLENIELSATVKVPADKEITLDLNGKTVSMLKAETVGANHEMIHNYGDLTIQDSATGGKLSYQYTGGSLGTTYAANTISTEPGSVLTVKSGIIENLTYDSAVIAYAIDGRTNGNAGDVTVNVEGGTISSLRQAIRIFANSQTNTGALNISGGDITGRVIVQNANAKANKAALSITGGTFNANAYKTAVLYVGGSTGASIDMTAAVSGGTFNGELESSIATGFITGGTFTTDVSELCAENYVTKDNGDGTYGVEFKALTGISVSAPAKTEYVEGKETLDLTGGKLTLTYSNGETEEIDLTAEMVTGFDNAVVGAQTLTATYGEFTATFEVTVVAYVAPAITTDIANVTFAPGDVTFTVEATGTGALNYAWFLDGAAIGENAATVTITADESFNGKNVYCVVTDAYGASVTSAEAKLILRDCEVKLVWISGNASVIENKTVVFAVTASNAVAYQWQILTDGEWVDLNVTGADTRRVSFKAVAAYDNAKLRCRVTDAYGVSLYTAAMLLEVDVSELDVTVQPVDQRVALNKVATFSVAMDGAVGNVKYVWYYSKNGGETWGVIVLPGYKTDTLNITAYESRIGWQFKCVMQDDTGRTIWSEPAVLEVSVNNLTIIQQPQDVSSPANTNATFTVKVGNTWGTVKYRWYFSKDNGATWGACGNNTNTLVMYATAGRDGYLFRCTISDDTGNVITTESAKMSVYLKYVERNGVYYATLEEAFADCEDGVNNITLMKDIALESFVTVPAGKTVNLYLNGKTISGVDNTNKNFGLIQNNGTLNIFDYSEEKTGKIVLSAEQDTGYSRYSAVISNNPGAKLTVHGGTIEHLGGHTMAYGIDNITNGGLGNVSLTIQGGAVKSSYCGIRQFLNSTTCQNELNVNKGVVEGKVAGVFFQSANALANNGTLMISLNASVSGDKYGAYISGDTAATEWPVLVYIYEAGVTGPIVGVDMPAGYEVQSTNGITSVAYTG